MPTSLIPRVEEISPINLTVREQTRLQDNPNDLRWPALFPRTPADSIRLADLTLLDFRPIALRREWNAAGMEMPDRVPGRREYEMVPINPKKTWNERELQLLRERFLSNREAVGMALVKGVDQWATMLADAVDRQLEVDAFNAWFNNAYTLFDPQNKSTISIALGMSATRYVTAGTAWDDAGVNAYDLLLADIATAVNLMGSIGAVRTRRSVVNAIVADAPTASGFIRPTVANLEDRLSEEGWGSIKVIIDERTYDKPDAGSMTATTATNYVPAGKIAFQPARPAIGRTHFAPVTRAFDYMGGAAARKANLQDVALWYEELNAGKSLVLEAQANAIPIPDEQFCFVRDTLVT